MVAGRVPHTCGKLYLGSDKAFVGPRADFPIWNSHVATDDTECTASLGCNGVNVPVPFQVGLNGDAQVLNTAVRWSLSGGVMEMVVVYDRVFAGRDGENLALVRMEFHQPVSFPFA